MDDVYYAAGDYTQDMLSLMESNIKPDRTDMDLLFACLLDWGLPLSIPHTHEKIDGFTVSPEKINVFVIFKLLSPNTNVRMI